MLDAPGGRAPQEGDSCDRIVSVVMAPEQERMMKFAAVAGLGFVSTAA